MSSDTSAGLSLTSSAFQPDQAIPVRHTCDGQDLSPPLAWDSPPSARSFALVVDDPDAPRGVFTHWVYFDLPAETRALPEGVARTERPAPGGMQGRNDFGKLGHNGPCPPRGPAHRYRFALYALDALVDLSPGSSKQQVQRAIAGHILAQAQLVGTYRRRA